MKKIFIFSLFISSLFSLGVVQNDVNYEINNNKQVDIIFPVEYSEKASVVKEYLDEIFLEYDKSFGHHLTNKTTLSLTSYHNQIPNATATVIPNTIMTWYGAGSAYIDYFNTPDWSKTLALHESAHLYQLDAKQGPSTTLEKYLGSQSMPLFVWWLPIFVNPNILMPDLLLEGNAVFNESRFGVGGRLYGGRHRALFLSLLKGNKLGAKRLLNNHNKFPFLEEKYIVGGYFFAYLSQRYGVDKVNSFFKAHASLYVNPLNLSKTMKAVFGKSYSRLIYEFLVTWVDDAKKFAITEGELLAVSLKSTAFGEGRDEFYFMSDSLVDYPKIYTLKKDGSLEGKIGDFFNGKPFKIGEKFYTTTSTIVENYKQNFSLFDENREELPGFRGKIVQDIHIEKEKTLYFRGDKFGSNELYLNSTPYDTINSSAMFDKRGNIFYFKQNEDKRELYINKKKYLSFKGFDSKIVDIDNKKVYFTAPSDLGNALYVFKFSKPRSLHRVGDGDDIIDAKHIKEDLFLLNTVTSMGYEYKLSTLREKKDFPKFWKYSFANSGNLKEISHSEELEHHEYNHLTNLKFNSLYPSFSFAEDGSYNFALNSSFSDPLQQNSLSLSFSKSEEKYENSALNTDKTYFGIGYANRRFLTPFSLFYAKYEGENLAISERDYFFSAYTNYPFLVDSRNRFDISFLYYHDKKYKNHEPIVTTLEYLKNVSFDKSFFPKNYFDLKIYNRVHKSQVTNGAYINYGRGFNNSFFVDGSVKYSKSNQNVIMLDKPSSLVTDNADFTLLDTPLRYLTDEMMAYKLQGKFAVDKSYYFRTFPLSLQDLTLFLYEENVAFDIGNQSITVTEDVIGAELNVLAMHRFMIPITLKYVINNKVKDDDKGKFLFSLSTNY